MARSTRSTKRTGRGDAVPRGRHVEKKKPVYTCSGCKYESNRQFNVLRHEQRIHSAKKLRVCCGSKFYTKGDYYIHCEQKHPETRANMTTSRNKYKIVGDTSVTFDRQYKRKTTAYNFRLRRKLNRTRVNDSRKMESKVSVKYSLTYSEFDIEDIPLISFLTDRRLKSYLRNVSSMRLTGGKDSDGVEKSKDTMKIAVSSKQNIQKTVSRVQEGNVVTKLSDSSVSSISVELPAKKLILHRFRTNVKSAFEMPLRELNNNSCDQVNYAEKRDKDKLSVSRRRSKITKLPEKENKNGVSKFAFSLEKQINIKLDTGITGPVVTQLHRDFLSSIDFDSYKIF